MIANNMSGREVGVQIEPQAESKKFQKLVSIPPFYYGPLKCSKWKKKTFI